MKKTLIALAVLGATAGVAHAQSNVTIYGIVDTGFVKVEGSKLAMDEKVNNRLGFRGVEDLGGGLKATFELEKRFRLNDGTTNGSFDSGGDSENEFDGASNVGLAGKWGAVRFGRMNELSTETIRTMDPFNQYGVGGMFESPLRRARISNTTRYDSPNFAGFSFGASFTTQGDTAGDNNGYAVSGKYLNGPVAVVANYNRATDSDESHNWNVGAAYKFGPAKVSLAYEKTTLKAVTEGADPATGADVTAASLGDYKNWLVGASYKIGAGTINASFNRVKSDLDNGTDFSDKKIALGYTHDLSKRTSVYFDIAQVRYDEDRNASDDNVMAYQLGMTHKF